MRSYGIGLSVKRALLSLRVQWRPRGAVMQCSFCISMVLWCSVAGVRGGLVMARSFFLLCHPVSHENGTDEVSILPTAGRSYNNTSKSTMDNQQQHRRCLIRQRHGIGLLVLPTFVISTSTSHAFSCSSSPAFSKRSWTIVAASKGSSDDISRSPLECLLGPPPQLVGLAVGEQFSVQRSDHQKYTVERVSDEPHAFILRNFLADDESNEIIQRAGDQGMETAETKNEEGSNSRQNCRVAWLSSFPLEKQLVKDIRSLLIQEEVASSSDLMVELLQVLKYDEGGLYQIHHDGDPRFLTVIYYLNGVHVVPICDTWRLGPMQ